MSELNECGMPKECLYGTLGTLAEDMQVEPGIAYPALLTVYSLLPKRDEMNYTRINLYCALVAPAGGGKTTAIDRAMRSLGVEDSQDIISCYPSSDRELSALLADHQKMLIITQDMSAVFEKAGIQNSSLFPTLNAVWDRNLKGFADRRGTQTVDCRLSWIGGLHPEDFKAYFSRVTANSIMSRLILGYYWVPFNHHPWEPKTYQQFEYADVEFSPAANGRLEEWRDLVVERDPDGRLFYILKKVALLSASANHDDSVGLDCLHCAEQFIQWQMKLRELFKPAK